MSLEKYFLLAFFFLNFSCILLPNSAETEQEYIDDLYRRLVSDLRLISARIRYHTRVQIVGRPVWDEFARLSENQNSLLMRKLNQAFQGFNITRQKESLAIIFHINKNVLRGHEKTREVIPTLLHLIDQSKQHVKYQIIITLGGYKEHARLAVPKLISFLASEDESLRSRSIEALGKIGSPSLPAVPKIIIALKDESSMVRTSAALALSQIDKSEESAKELVFLLKDKDQDVRAYTAKALGNIGKNAARVQKHLLPCLQDEDGFVRSWSAESLGNIGQRSESVLSSLIKQLKKEKRGTVKQNIVIALGKIATLQDKKVLEILEQETHSENCYVEKEAKEALEKIKVK